MNWLLLLFKYIWNYFVLNFLETGWFVWWFDDRTCQVSRIARESPSFLLSLPHLPAGGSISRKVINSKLLFFLLVIFPRNLNTGSKQETVAQDLSHLDKIGKFRLLEVYGTCRWQCIMGHGKERVVTNGIYCQTKARATYLKVMSEVRGLSENSDSSKYISYNDGYRA